MTNNLPEELEIVNLDIIAEQRKLNPHAPWNRARELQDSRAAEFLNPQEIYNKVTKFNNIRDQCLYLLMYITAGRIGEIVIRDVWKIGKKMARVVKNSRAKNKYVQDFTKKTRVKTELGLIKSNLIIEELEDTKILTIQMKNLKNKQKHENIKIQPFPLNNELNIKINNLIQQYLSTLEPEDELFPIGIRRAEQIINKVGFNPHFLRSCRLTHLVKYYNFTDQQLKIFAGWSDSRPSKHYIKMGWRDTAKRMIQEQS